MACAQSPGEKALPDYGLGFFPGLEAAHHPPSLVDTAGLSVKPSFRSVANIACEEVTAREAVLGVSGRNRSHHPARACSRILPWCARIFFTLGKNHCRGLACRNKVPLNKFYVECSFFGFRRNRLRNLRRRLFLLFPEQRTQLVGEATAACQQTGDGKSKCGRYRPTA